MASESGDGARSATRQIKAALGLRRRYQTLTGKSLSISELRKDEASMEAFLDELVQLGDDELLRCATIAFDAEGFPDSATLRKRPEADSGAANDATMPARRFFSPIAVNLLAAVLLVVVIVLAARSGGSGSGIAVAEALRTGSGPAPMLTLSGSNTIGEKLGPMMVQAYLKSAGYHDVEFFPDKSGTDGYIGATVAPDGTAVRIDLHAHGSATAFAALEKSEAQIGMSSRVIKEEERTRLSTALGDLSQPGSEHVLGLDGIAVIVNPSNPVRALSVEQVARIFSGDIRNWAEVGGNARPIQLLARDEKSGTWDTFKYLVLERHGRKLSTDAKRLESSSELSDTVSSNPDAVGFVGLPYVRTATALAIADVAGGRALAPTPFTVATEDYPLSRRLYLYTPAVGLKAQTQLQVAKFVDFALSPAGQDVVQEAGFIPQRITPARVAPMAEQPDDYRRLAAEAERLSLTFRFRPGSNDLDTKALRDVDRVLGYLAARPGARVFLMGFTDSTGNPSVNVQLAHERAQAVQAALVQRGVGVAQLLAFGAAMPLAGNDSDLGRQKNRRVEIWVRG